MLMKGKWRMYFQLCLCKADLLCCMHLHNHTMLNRNTSETIFLLEVLFQVDETKGL